MGTTATAIGLITCTLAAFACGYALHYVLGRERLDHYASAYMRVVKQNRQLTQQLDGTRHFTLPSQAVPPSWPIVHEPTFHNDASVPFHNITDPGYPDVTIAAPTALEAWADSDPDRPLNLQDIKDIR